MKKILLIICLLLLCSCKKNPVLNSDTFSYGAKVDIKNITDKKYKCKSKILDTSQVKDYTEKIICNKKNYEIKYSVIDNVKPIIWINNTVTRNIGYNEDISQELTCMDNADRNPIKIINGDYDVNTLGNYDLTFTCTDKSGNSSSKDFKLIIKNKVQNVNGNNSNVLTNYTSFNDIYKERKNEKTLIGIDVSKYQGNIDWEKVKNDGVEFAIIRLGYRYFYDEPLTLDPYFKQNIEGATKAGIKIGVYFYSYAKNKEDAINEANFVLDNIKGYNIEMPIAFDWESFNYFNAGQMNLFDLRNASEEFLNVIKNAGYTPIHYASKAYLEYIWLPINYDIWLAHYAKQTTYQGDYLMWQLSSTGKVDGINNYVDINVYYKK